MPPTSRRGRRWARQQCVLLQLATHSVWWLEHMTTHAAGGTLATQLDDSGDTIAPEEARERFASAVNADEAVNAAVNANAKREVVDMTMAELMADNDSNGPVLYVPATHKGRILRLYGTLTMRDFDKMYGMNAKMGKKYDDCFHTTMYWMDVTDGRVRDQWDKVSGDKVLSDLFNLVQSAVRSRVGECEWYS